MRKTRFLSMALALSLCVMSTVSMAEEIGSIDTTFRALGANDQIVVQAFDDPEVTGIACYLSSAKTGGISGSIGLASDKSDASVACRQIGPISFDPNLKTGKDVFSQKSSLFFKKLHVVRMIDTKRKVLVYLTYSDHLVDGSPKNSITAVSYGAPQ
jgi:CreA protein